MGCGRILSLVLLLSTEPPRFISSSHIDDLTNLNERQERWGAKFANRRAEAAAVRYVATFV